MEIKVLKDILSANDQMAYNTPQLMGKLNIFEVSCTTGQGIEHWVSWLLSEMGWK